MRHVSQARSRVPFNRVQRGLLLLSNPRSHSESLAFTPPNENLDLGPQQRPLYFLYPKHPPESCAHEFLLRRPGSSRSSDLERDSAPNSPRRNACALASAPGLGAAIHGRCGEPRTAGTNSKRRRRPIRRLPPVILRCVIPAQRPVPVPACQRGVFQVMMRPSRIRRSGSGLWRLAGAFRAVEKTPRELQRAGSRPRLTRICGPSTCA
ncbi:hypothetical protein B0H15DRAFT_503730 [Mycena belliarum]|uniref:Uncharacterized protein n=1 Tax=Mycena belliarum TaxID=1033014 RepID=A0AAD6XVY8_9AGAR|nr:hypothetical protein B0H15DRAFT_503730 [Mycena belliae]